MLTIPEKVFLLCIDDIRGTTAKGIYGAIYFGLAGGLLAELALRGKLVIQEKRLLLVDQSATGDELLDETLEIVATSRKPHKSSYWISLLAPKNLSAKIAGQLAAKNILRVEKKRYLWVIQNKACSQADASAKYWIKQHLRSVVLAGEKPDRVDVALLGLLKACSLLNLVFTRDERRAAEWRVEKMVSSEVLGLAAEVLENIDMALNAATSGTSMG